MVGLHREAPSVFKHRGMYYMITSGCTGWAPNAAQVHSSESMLGVYLFFPFLGCKIHFCSWQTGGGILMI